RIVRQGDPLSPFLFILAVEGLNVIVNEAVAKEWDKDNARALMCILKCFEEVSGLKVNFNKSKVYSVGVNSNEIAQMARWMGCSMGEFPFTYLGLPIGESMRRSSAWRPVVEKFKKRLSDWRAKSIIYGANGGLVDEGGRGLGLGGRDVWCDIVKVGSDIDEVGIDFTSSFMCKLGIRGEVGWQIKEGRKMESVSGNEIGCGSRALGDVDELLGVLHNIVVSTNCRDIWRWSLHDSGNFSVKVLTRMIEEKTLALDSSRQETMWNKLVPKKETQTGVFGTAGAFGSRVSTTAGAFGFGSSTEWVRLVCGKRQHKGVWLWF
ncbi:hypothetical protein Tco_1288404, partial [Tanacetum coccineum]